MRLLPFLIVLGLAVGTVGGCRCGADVASPVTLRIKNTNNDPIYVDATGGTLGMQVQRNVLGTWNGFVEQPACACLACEQVCRGCDCQPGQQQNLVQKVPGGGTLERPWSGIVQVEGVSSCGAVIGGTPCLKAEIPSVDETFRVRFCYAPSAPGINDTTDGGTPVAGTLKPDSLLCVNREFRVADGVVEVSPAKGADCTSHAQCQGDGGTSLCFNGACTTSCPANDFPQLGGTWTVSVPEPDDLGFFTFTTEGQNKIYSGTGTVSSVRYDNNVTTLRLQRPATPSGFETGAAYVALPPGYAVPFNVGETVAVRIVDASSRTYGNRAITIRDGQGKLILAADPAQLAPVLSASDLAPFTVATTTEVVGCDYTDCGKRLYTKTRFTGGEAPVELGPGKSASLVSGGAAYKALNVSNGAYRVTSCNIKSAMPYVILVDRTAP